jgi:DNA replication and repair protein RecF
VSIVSGEEFGQIFITDTNREHLDKILENSSHDYKIFYVDKGEVTEKEDV